MRAILISRRKADNAGNAGNVGNVGNADSGEAAIQDSLGRSPRNGNKTGGLALKARENNRCLLCVCYLPHPWANIFHLPNLLGPVHILIHGASHMTISTILRRYGETFDERYVLD